MTQTDDKLLFGAPFRRRGRRPLVIGERPKRLLGGQALAEAQRLSRPRVKPDVFIAMLVAVDITIMLVTGLIARSYLTVMPPLEWVQICTLWLGTLTAVVGVRSMNGYRFDTMRRLERSLYRLTMALGLTMVVMSLVLKLSGLALPGQGRWLLGWMALGWLLMAGARVLMRNRILKLIRTGEIEHRLAVVGGGNELLAVLRAFDAARSEGYRVCGVFDQRGEARSQPMVAGHHKMGDLEDLLEFSRLAQIDTIVLALPGLSETRRLELLGALHAAPVEVRALPWQGMPARMESRKTRIGSLTLVELCRPPVGGWNAVQKRGFDLVTALVALLLVAPVMIGVAIAIRMETPGPIFFRQTRHGFNSKPIKVLKFRSMYVDRCDPSAVKAVRQGDPRVTRVGRIIRKTSLDELPQLFNVLSGTLSMVGPRPHATAARTGDILYDEVAAAYSVRHKVKPGITGWAQINGWRGELNSAEKIRARVAHDLYYIENWSLWLDLKILLLTPYALINTKNAY